MRDLLRAPAELRTQAELDALVANDGGAKPPGWRLSPRAVETYLLGSPKPVGGVAITPKYVGDRAIVQVAIATLASDRALLLVGEPGTAKSWLSEHLAAAVSGTSSLVVQGTAGTTEDQIKYGWNYALLLAEGPSRRALVPSPVLRAMEGGQFVRFEEVTRAAAEVQDALISILSEKQIAVPELDELVTARRGFNVIATANSRDRGVNEMSAALKRRFNFVTVPVIEDPEQEARVVAQREAELRADYQVGAAPPPELARMLVTMFHELRRGVTRDGRTKVRAPDAVLSTAEAISVLFQGGILAQSFGSGQTGVDEIARALVGAVTKDGNDDVKVLREYLETVAKHRPAPWKDLHERAKARLPKLRAAAAPPEPAMADLDRALFCPVRHHSPRSSAVVRALLDRARPRLVLIEGPSDATHLAPLLLDPETAPPVALLGYRTDGEVASAFWPFAAYSPEYVALRWALEHGAEARFIDIPAAVSLSGGVRALREGHGGPGGGGPKGGGGPGGAPKGGGEPAAAPGAEGGSGSAPAGGGEGEAADGAPGDGPARTVFEACAEGAGMRTFEELWESHLEAPAYEPDDFRALVVEFAHLARLRPRDVDRAREAFMLRQIGEALAGAGGGGVAVVAGAAHVAALVAGDVDPAREADLPAPAAAALTVIPYSFTRLSEQAGYGAGNRAPRFFQRAFERGCDFERAALDSLLELAAELRLEGHSASLADALEAFRLARTLAGMRGKASAGLDELFEASTATFGRGDRAAIDAALSRIVIGSQVGRVSKKAGQGSLQREFWREVRRLGLPEGDLPRQVLLHLTQDAEIESSVFLQRLRVAGVPYAHFLGLTRVARGQAPDAAKAPARAGGVEALRRATEAWEAQWTPATEAVLVEKVVLGDSLEAVCTRLLCERAGAARSTGEAAECALDAALAGCVGAAGRTLDRCERLAAADEDVASLAHGCAVLSCLLRYRGARLDAFAARASVEPLCVHWFRRAALRLPARAAACGDDAAPGLRAAMRALHDVALTQPAVDPDLWWDALERVEGDFAAHASLSGFALGLLHLVERAGDARVAAAFALRLGPGAESPARAAAHVAGFLEVNPQAVVRSRPVVAALDGFFAALDAEAFRALLPALRKAFARLGPFERRSLLEGVFAARGLERTPAARAAVSAGEREALAALGGDLDRALQDLDGLF